MFGALGAANEIEREPGYTAGFVPADGFAGGVASFAFIYRTLSAGPEVIALYGGDRRLFSVGGVVRLGPATGTVRPYGVLGGGRYAWDVRQSLPPGTPPFWGSDLALFSGSAGAGLMFGDRLNTVSFTVEARLHRNLQHEDFERDHRMLYTLMLGTRVVW